MNTEGASRVVLVTGGLGDIGKATAQKFAGMGWRVAVHDLVDEEAGGRQVESWKTTEGEYRYFSANHAVREEVSRLYDALEESLGLPCLVIANAGVVAPASFLEMSEENWRFHLEANLTGSFFVAQEAARRWVAAKSRGTLLFTSSWVQDTPQSGISAYCVSKSGLKMLAQTMALELGRYGIRVNLVAPGIVDAGLSGRLFRERASDPAEFVAKIPLGALQTAAQVADVFWLLAQPEADYITGTTLFADGGMSLFQFQKPQGD